MLVGIQDEILRLHSLGLLHLLLADKTTKKNIIWGTDTYSDRGECYQNNKEIFTSLITGANSDVIKNRARKTLEKQSTIIRKQAELFTPLWVCKQMISQMDAEWFGKVDAFLADEAAEKVNFPKRKKWQHYVDTRRLEITCGEAPFLVQRYDVCTGEFLKIEDRNGILDRKLRIVNENAVDEEDWITWALRAYQSTYGYEFRGDYLLIARVNLLMTFEEYLYSKWNRKPTTVEYRKVINTIVWNIWQMDGLNGKIPYCKDDEAELYFQQGLLFETEKPYQQESLFPGMYDCVFEESSAREACYIYDWRRDNSLKYINVNNGGRNMKFDFVIGNPPYQEDHAEGNKPAQNIFQLFQEEADKIASKGTILIYPAKRWLHHTGKGMKKFGVKQINDLHLKKVIVYPHANEVFPNAGITDGVSIVLKNMSKQSASFTYVYCKKDKQVEVLLDNPKEALIAIEPNV